MLSNIQENQVNIVILIHSLIISIGIIGNSLVIIMFVLKKSLRNARNAFMVIDFLYAYL
jgi:hypothetical protein